MDAFSPGACSSSTASTTAACHGAQPSRDAAPAGLYGLEACLLWPGEGLDDGGRARAEAEAVPPLCEIRGSAGVVAFNDAEIERYLDSLVASSRRDTGGTRHPPAPFAGTQQLVFDAAWAGPWETATSDAVLDEEAEQGTRDAPQAL
ncbi:hypothetical protein CDD83_5053 [Cordyceps sp. RAO-2017]|nr:hypothetical protein CDD83_5053 [Cordyceps sp. RAO-2017]